MTPHAILVVLGAALITTGAFVAFGAGAALVTAGVACIGLAFGLDFGGDQ